VTPLLRRAQEFVGVPYVLHGETPEGWDCLGCVRFLRLELFGLSSPRWTHDYGSAEALGAPRAEDLIKLHLPAWDRLDVPAGAAPPPGSVLLFRRFGRAGHVGLMLDRGQFIHAEQGCRTVIAALSNRWETRILGAYDARPEPLRGPEAVQPGG
jgi:cell wall-associated NlpC family hydrolase